jgi:hypothetical protein
MVSPVLRFMLILMHMRLVVKSRDDLNEWGEVVIIEARDPESGVLVGRAIGRRWRCAEADGVTVTNPQVWLACEGGIWL